MRSRLSRSRSTIAARLLPWFCMRVSRARAAAVNDVSPAEKNADSSRLPSTIRSEIQLSPLMVRSLARAELFGEEGADLGDLDVARHECLADSAHQNEGELAALDLFVLGNEVH